MAHKYIDQHGNETLGPDLPPVPRDIPGLTVEAQLAATRRADRAREIAADLGLTVPANLDALALASERAKRNLP